jgi:signal transduction histidine kinase
MTSLASSSGERVANGPGGGAALDRKRIVLLLRCVVIATSTYVALTGSSSIGAAQIWYVLLFVASNAALALAPRELFYMPHFGPLLLLADTGLILLGLSWSHGLSRDLLVVYFFTVFLITVGETLAQIAIGSALIAGMYGYWLWASGGDAEASMWVRLPFFFLIGIFYASLVDQLKSERHRRRKAEEENHHLRFLLDLASVFSETHASREFVAGIGRFVEGTCSGLRCELVLRGKHRSKEPGGVSFGLRAHGEDYGVLRVRTADPRGLSERERWLCQMVSHAAAGALYAADQSSAAKIAAEAKEQFLATVSHEFRTPLHAILGYLDMLDALLPRDAEPPIRESVERTRVNACRLQHLLEELLSFAEVRSGRRIVRPERVNVNELVAGLIPITRELVAGKPVTLGWRVAENVGEIWIDGRKLQRVLACLLSNAAKFTDAGQIDLTAHRESGGSLELVIADTGIGIARSDLDLIFDDFQQVDGSFTRRYGGLGIGLALARELVALLGGTMKIQSELGAGTKVSVRLPSDVIEPVGSRRVAGEPSRAQSQRAEPPTALVPCAPG